MPHKVEKASQIPFPGMTQVPTAPVPATTGSKSFGSLLQDPQLIQLFAQILGKSFGGGFGSLAAGQSVQQAQELQRQLNLQKEEREEREERRNLLKRQVSVTEAEALRRAETEKEQLSLTRSQLEESKRATLQSEAIKRLDILLERQAKGAKVSSSALKKVLGEAGLKDISPEELSLPLFGISISSTGIPLIKRVEEGGLPFDEVKENLRNISQFLGKLEPTVSISPPRAVRLMLGLPAKLDIPRDQLSAFMNAIANLQTSPRPDNKKRQFDDALAAFSSFLKPDEAVQRAAIAVFGDKPVSVFHDPKRGVIVYDKLTEQVQVHSTGEAPQELGDLSEKLSQMRSALSLVIQGPGGKEMLEGDPVSVWRNAKSLLISQAGPNADPSSWPNNIRIPSEVEEAKGFIRRILEMTPPGKLLGDIFKSPAPLSFDLGPEAEAQRFLNDILGEEPKRKP